MTERTEEGAMPEAGQVFGQEVFGTVDEAFGGRVKHYREKAGLSQDQLAERIANHGGAIHQTTILRTERGERHATLSEFLLFAAALNVPPPLLLIPLGDERTVAITPKSKIHPHLALKWFVGYEFLADSDRRVAGQLNEWLNNSRPLHLHNRLQEVQDTVHVAWVVLTRAEFVDDEAEIKKARANLVDPLRALSDVLSQLRKEGMEPPRMPTEWVEKMDELGLNDARRELGLETKEGR